MRRIALFSTLALAVASCQDAGIVPTEFQDPSFVIQDGQTGGNPDFFWLPPMVSNPNQHPDFESGEFNPDLAPELHICSIGSVEDPPGAGLAACVDEPAVIQFGEGPIDETVIFDDEHYHYDWHTDEVPAGGVNPTLFYRVVAIVGTRELGFADFDVVSTGKEMKNVNTATNIALKDGRTLPVKFRIENGALCDPEAIDCASKTIDFGEGGTVALDDGDNVEIPAQDPATTGILSTITVTPCTGELPVDIPVFGPCLEVTADPPFVYPLEFAATISICTFDEFDLTGIVDHEQEDLVTLHRVDNGEVFSLPHRPDNCDEVLGSRMPDDSRLMRLARAGLGAIRGALGLPTPLDARAPMRRRLDIGRGGASPFFSSFQHALPSKMVKLPGTDDQSAPVGENVDVPPGVLVTDLDGTPVANATVTFEITEGDGAIGSTMISVLSGADGMASANFWTLGLTPGTNTVEASGFGIAVEGNDGPRPYFDPFTPIKLPNPDDEVLVQLQTGAFDFTATGGLPDLIVESLTHDPEHPYETDEITFAAGVKNVGGVAAGPSTLEFRIGGETPGTPNTQFAVPALAPGESFVVVRTETLTAQGYQNTAVADVDNVVSESNEYNNQTIDQYTVAEVVQ